MKTRKSSAPCLVLESGLPLDCWQKLAMIENSIGMQQAWPLSLALRLSFFKVETMPRRTCTGYLGHPFKNKPFETEKDLLLLLANTGGWVYNQTSSTAYSCSINDALTGWRSFLYGWCCDTSPAAEGWLLGCSLCSLYSLDKTVRDLIAARNPHRPWEKQVPAHRGKCALTTTTHRSQAAGETATHHQDRSHPPRPAGQAGSCLAAGSGDRATRDEARAGIGSSFACTGSASPRRILTSRKLLQKPLP